MLKKSVQVVLLLGVAVLFFASLGLAKSKTLTLNKNVVLPDGQTLSAGKYEVVVDQKVDEVHFIQNDKVVVKHRCKCVEQAKKNASDGYVVNEEAPNKVVLQEVRLQGETRIIHLPS